MTGWVEYAVSHSMAERDRRDSIEQHLLWSTGDQMKPRVNLDIYDRCDILWENPCACV
jgi:hypothetical protein